MLNYKLIMYFIIKFTFKQINLIKYYNLNKSLE